MTSSLTLIMPYVRPKSRRPRRARPARRSNFRRAARPVRRPRRGRISRGVVVRPLGGIAERCVTRHKYFSTGTTSVGALFLTNRVFFTNNLYDPEQTGVGHQPMGFDQMAARYRTYSVLKCNLFVRCWNQSNAISYASPISVILSPLVPWKSGTPVLPDVYSVLMERSGTKHATCLTSRACRLGYTWSARDDYDSTTKESNTVTTEVAGAEVYPPSNSGICFTLTSADGVTVSGATNISYELTIVYTVLWSQPRDLPGS